MPTRRDLSEAEKAYIAGIVDGEGCVSLSVRKQKYVTPTVQVSNTCWELLVYLLEIYGGNIDIRKDNRPTRKQCNTWRVAARRARLILNDIVPYLIVKKAQAYLVLNLRLRSRGCRLSSEEVEENMEVIGQMRAMNKRGR